MTRPWLTKVQKRVLVAMWELQRPVMRDMLMSHLGRAVSGRCMDGLENDGLAIAHEKASPTDPRLWTLTPAGEKIAQELTVQ